VKPGDHDRPYLPRGVRLRRCDVRQAWFLLAPERALRLDAIGSAILSALDGERRFAEVVARLAADYGAPPDRVAADARKFLADLMDKRMVEVA
jgi:pyrroloquinoline quinone biosynthesis protein D